MDKIILGLLIAVAAMAACGSREVVSSADAATEKPTIVQSAPVTFGTTMECRNVSTVVVDGAACVLVETCNGVAIDCDFGGR